jgi:hypothetical protein
MKISDILFREAIVTDLRATTKESAFRELVSSVQNAGHLAEVDPVELVHVLQWREELSSQLMNSVRTVTGKTGRGPHYVNRNASAAHRDQPAGAVMFARKRRPVIWFDLLKTQGLVGSLLQMRYYLERLPIGSVRSSSKCAECDGIRGS